MVTLRQKAYIKQCQDNLKNSTNVAQAPNLIEEEINNVDNDIEFALALDLERRPRMNRSGTERIEVHRRKQACENEKMLVLHIAKLWGWKDESLHPRRRMKIARATCTQVAYDFGYAKPLSAV